MEKKFFDLAVAASGQAKDLGYLEEPELKICKSARGFCRAWLSFLIDNRDSEAFRLRVDNPGNLRDLSLWCDSAGEALNQG